MIVTCEQCSRRFHLDESRISSSGSKVRCSKCKHVFRVFPPPAITEKPLIEPLESSDMDTPLSFSGWKSIPSFEEKETPVGPPAHPSDNQETTLLDTSMLLPSDLKLEMEKQPFPVASENEPAPGDSGFASEINEASKISPEDIDLFQESQPQFQQDLIAQPSENSHPETSPSTFMDEIHVEDDQEPDVALTMENNRLETARPETEQVSKGGTFSFDDIEALDLDEIERLIEKSQMGEHRQSAKPDDLLPSEGLDEMPFDRANLDDGGAQKGASLTSDGVSTLSSFTETAVLDTSNLPMGHDEDRDDRGTRYRNMLAIKERKPVSKTLVGLLCLVVLAGIGYVGMTFFPDLKLPFFAANPPVSEDIAGNLKIRIFDVNSQFADSSVAGRLFVITGKIRNDYPEPRGFVQIKGKLYDTAKKVVQSQTGYCGNVIADTDLTAMNDEAIRKALSNRLGADRSNAKIPPGGIVPFMIVFSQLSGQLDEFSLEVVSSVKIP